VTTREQAIASQICMTPTGCDDCREYFQSYMVQDEIWKLTGLPFYGALLCLPCLQIRIRRDLIASDFLVCPANNWFSIEER
jgi:hypothetical protein